MLKYSLHYSIIVGGYMRKIRNSFTLASVSALITFILLINLSSFFGGNKVYAATNLNGIASLKILEIKNGTTDLLANPSTPVIYGDIINFKLHWAFPDGPDVPFNEPITYPLPGNVTFTSAHDVLKSTKDGSVLGTYEIDGTQITLTYTAPNFCSGDTSRVGDLNLEGIITKNNQQTQVAAPVKVTFDSIDEYTFNMVPPPVTPKLDVLKDITDASNPNPDHIYDCYVQITSTGTNNNVVFADEMWPGMYLYSSPEYFTDSSMTTPRTDVNDTSETPSSTNRTLHAEVPVLNDGEVIYVHYQVKVIDDMYDLAKANAYIANYRSFYPSVQYGGNVSNRAEAWSDEIGEKNKVMKWKDVRTLHVQFGKWGDPNQSDTLHGLIGWQIIVYNMYNDPEDTVTIVDTLPENTKLGSYVTITAGGSVIDNGISYTTSYDASGRMVVTFTLDPSVVTYLKSSDNAEAVINYQTKVLSQEKDEDFYKNEAIIYFDGAEKMKTEMTVSYKKPNAVIKDGHYGQGTAPYAQFKINVNTATLDLNPNGNKITLVDELSPSYDLRADSVIIDGQPATAAQYSYNAQTRKLTFELDDTTEHLITYDAYVNLAPGSQFTDANSYNNAWLYAGEALIAFDDSTFQIEIFDSAASSSSITNPCEISVFKHAQGDPSNALSGAEFDLVRLTIDKNGVATDVSTVSKTTGADGKLNFDNLEKGIVYMLRETTAPGGYDLDSTMHFYAFRSAAVSLPAEITYNGTKYTITLITSGTSYDVDLENTKTTTPTSSSSETSASSSETSASDTTLTSSSVETSASESSTPTSGADSSNRSNIPSTGDNTSYISVLGIMAGIGGLALLAFRMRLKKTED